MLEIVLIFACSRSIGKIVEAKGRSKFGYQLMLVALWLGGEFVGGIAGALVQAAQTGGIRPQGFPCLVYGCALVGAAVGAGIAFAIANSLTPIRTDDFYRRDAFDIDRVAADRFGRRAPESPPVRDESDAYTRPASGEEPGPGAAPPDDQFRPSSEG